MMTTTEQAVAIAAEFTADAAKSGHKIANCGRGEMGAKFGGTEYRCVYRDGRINWYVGGKLTSKKEMLAKLDASLIAERTRF